MPDYQPPPRAIGVYTMGSHADDVSTHSIGVYAMGHSAHRNPVSPAQTSPPFTQVAPGAVESSLNVQEIGAENPGFCFQSLLRAAFSREDDDDEEEAELTHAISLAPFSTSQTPSSSSHLPRSSSTKDNLQGSRKVRKVLKSKAQGHLYRRRKRQQAAEKASGDYKIRSGTVKKYICAASTIPSTFQAEQVRVASSGFIGLAKRAAAEEDETFLLEDLVGPGSRFGFKLHQWDGRLPTPVVDRTGKIIAVLAGHPDDEGWEAVHLAAAQALEDARPRCQFPSSSLPHRRGKFSTLHGGVSFGNGQKQPLNLRNAGSPVNQEVADDLAKLSPFRRLAGFTSAAFKAWNPEVFDYYASTLGRLFASDPSLKRPFPCSIFPTATYNLGPCTVCVRHTDHKNLPFGWCSITSLGSFDPKKGGHLILWDCKLVVEFPPGSTVLIPSAILSHSNVDIREGERRYSFTQYAPGGLFRWVEHGFKNKERYFSNLKGAQLEAELDREAGRWVTGLSLIPTVDKLKQTKECTYGTV